MRALARACKTSSATIIFYIRGGLSRDLFFLFFSSSFPNFPPLLVGLFFVKLLIADFYGRIKSLYLCSQ